MVEIILYLKSCGSNFSFQVEGLFERSPASRTERDRRSVLLAGALLLSPSGWNKKIEAQDSKHMLILT